MSKQEIISDIKGVFSQHGKITRKLYDEADTKYSRFIVNKEFGSWNNAVVEAGLPTSRKNYTDEEVIQAIRDFYDKTGSNNSDLFRVEGGVKLTAVERHFGSWVKGLQIAGIKPNRVYGSTKKELVEALISASKECDGILTIEKYKQANTLYSAETIRRKFGSWPNALREAGLEVSRSGVKKTDNELLGRLKHEELSSNQNINNSCYYKRFPNKSWKEILELANIDVDKRQLGNDNTFYDSIEEKRLADLLYQNFIDYEPHKRVCEDRKWTCDFYLPNQDLWVEYDGLGESRKRPDKFAEKIQYYKDNQFNYIILTSKDDVLDKLCLRIKHNYRFEVREINKVIADDFLRRVHYLKSASGRDKHRLGFYYNDILCGVVTFGGVANPHEKSVCLNRCAIFDRVRLPHPYNNTTSWMVARSLRWLKKTGYRGKVVSWHDPRHHGGTLYKACNFILVDNKMRSDYIYIDQEGNEYHKSKCRVPAGQSESNYANSLGLIKVIVPPKQRWEFIIR
jgi:hypothetical protein